MSKTLWPHYIRLLESMCKWHRARGRSTIILDMKIAAAYAAWERQRES